MSLIFLFFAGNASAQPPNVLLISIDDMGWRDTGFQGSRYYETPHLDELAAQWMIFSNAFALASNCAPSRACLMSGHWKPRHGIYTDNNSDQPVVQLHIRSDP